MNDGTSFSYLPGSWSPGWTVHAAHVNGDVLVDLFVYNPTSGAWYVCLNVGAGSFAYYAGTWSPSWEIHVTDLDGDGRSDIFVYNATDGRWYQCVTTGAGTFTYYGGTSPAGLTIVASGSFLR